MAEARSVAQNALFVDNLKSLVPPSKWATWFSAVRLELADDTLHVAVPSEFHLHWLKDHYHNEIASLARDLLGSNVSISYSIDEAEVSSLAQVDAPARWADTAPSSMEESPAEVPAETSPAPSSLFSTKYVFDTFVVGQSNRLALAAAMSVAERPGKDYNPLFIYGGAGLGKTHLLHAIVHLARTKRPNSSIRYINSEQFFNEFVDSIRRKRMVDFKHRYRSIDLLLLDDIQFFRGKEQVLEEVFHTFNTLYDLNKQMVLSCDRPPKDLGIEDRLCSRFQWGLLADISPPDVETRLAILRRNADYAPTHVPTEVLDFIARHITDNIRHLEGALTRVTAYAALTEQPLTLDLARKELRDIIQVTGSSPPTGDEILAVTAGTYDFSVTDLQGRSRRSHVVRARHIAMYLCRSLTDLSLPKIGALFGGRDHSTVSHAIDKITGLIQSNPQFAREITHLSERIRGT